MSQVGRFEFINSDSATGKIETFLESGTVVRPVIKELGIKDSDGNLLQIDDFVDTSIFSLISQKKGVWIDEVTDSESFTIKGFSDVPKEAMEISNRIVAGFMKEYDKLIQQEVSKARKTLENQLANLKKDLMKEEKKLQSFMQKEKVTDFEREKEVLTNQLLDLEKDEARISTEYRPGHPNLLSIKSQIRKTRERIDRIPQKQMELNRINNRIQTLRNLITSQEEDLLRIRMIGNVPITNVSVIESAAISDDPDNNIFFPKKKLITAVAIVVGSFFGICMVFLFEGFAEGIRTGEEMKELLKREPLVVIPRFSQSVFNADGIENMAEYSPLYDLFSSIRQLSASRFPKILTVTSAFGGEGKTTVAYMLARVAAMKGHRVLLIEANLRRPALRLFVEGSREEGLSQLLRGEVSMESLYLSTGGGKPDVIHGGRKELNPSAFIDTPHFQQYLTRMSETYDVIILDCEAIRDGNIVPVVSSMSEATIMVMAAKRTSWRKVESMIQHVQARGVSVMGIVLNEVKRI